MVIGMKELSIERMEDIHGGTRTKNNCSNLGNGIATAGLIFGMTALALATGPIGWATWASFALSGAGVVACQLGYA